MMRHYYTYISLAAAVMLATACVDEVSPVGEADREDCQHIYFPEEQVNIKDHMLEYQVDDQVLEFVCRRKESEGSCKVNYTVEESKEGIFLVDPIIFEDGQTETTFNVWFPKANISHGKLTCTIIVDDPAYASLYDAGSTSLEFSVQLVKWNKLSTDTSKALWKDALFSDMFTEWKGRYSTTEVDIYERSDKPGYYRLDKVYSAEYLTTLIEGPKDTWESEDLDDIYSNYTANSSIYVDATDKNKVWIPAQATGFYHPSYGMTYITSDVSESIGSGSNSLYGKLQDGVITFPKSGLLLGLGTYYYFSNTSGKAMIVLPGYTDKMKDYSVDIEEVTKDKVESGVTVSYTSAIKFTLGADAKEVRYNIYEGKVSDVEMNSKVEEIKAMDEDKVAKVTASGEIGLEIMLPEGKESGFYTLVACIYDGGGNWQGYDYIRFGYATTDDPHDVKIDYGIIVDNRYASEDYTSENSFTYWVTGEDITHAVLNLFPTSYVKTYPEYVEKVMKNTASMSSAYLKMLNEYEVSGIIGNTLEPGTSYTFVIYAGNGYKSRFFYHEFSTKGEQKPLEKIYYHNDLLEYMQPSSDNIITNAGPVSVENFCNSTWTAFSVDLYGDGGTRTERFDVSLKKQETADGGEQIITAEGLFQKGFKESLPSSDKYSYDDNPSIDFSYKDGCLYTIGNTRLGKAFVKDSESLIPSWREEISMYWMSLGTISSSGYYYDENDGLMVGGFVNEDVIAFVDNKDCLNSKGEKANYFSWAMILGGYADASYEDLVNYFGDAHGYLLLVRKGSKLIDDFKADQKLLEKEELDNAKEKLERSCDMDGAEIDITRMEIPAGLMDELKFTDSPVVHDAVTFKATTVNTVSSGGSRMEISSAARVKASIR